MMLFTPISLNRTMLYVALASLFFFSGVSALIYQVVWQRMLFIAFGVDLVSMTIIISVFMFGLGVGGLVGGRLADYFPARLLALYVIIELGIALFGFVSPWMINTLGTVFFSNNEVVTAITSFIILAIPTILMGATFPILVTHVNQTRQNIGDSVGGLYFVNTLGGAVGAYAVGFVLLSVFDTTGVVDAAAFLNLAIALSAYLIFRSK